jgi:hypothetical protein
LLCFLFPTSNFIYLSFFFLKKKENKKRAFFFYQPSVIIQLQLL